MHLLMVLLAVAGDQHYVRVQGVCCLLPVMIRCILRYMFCANAVYGPSLVPKPFRD